MRDPWQLLKKELPDGAVPAIGDYSAVVWLLHLGLGKDLTITDQRGRQVRLRIVGMLAGSILQGELVIAESRFLDLFPSITGYNFFLIETPPARADHIKQLLEHDLGNYGFDAASTTDRLESYLAVENTYLNTFQTLGGLGLLLGTIGLAAVLLRNVLERRGELALMQALGYRRSALARMVLAENATLLIVGMITGTVSALLAVAPHIATSPATIPWFSLGLTLLAVLLTGLIAGAAALIPTLRSPLLPALRSE
jgi:ABC-type antimicrobial peptide transport system permease subunit